ncbi:hypothetical protein NG895_22840 [Aeoliella sp. ICT_H6.2]|uniref:Lipoprotein n=1 Tax=Aeoliella straminimaris TaxID=2954799 RepID=A0A9X2FHC5_9BACT|nr:hypothetical protein [Aeoliella straminimaris]MCO6046744.1 hypothetical protein [Aeoliella straminimaris]
MNTRLLPARATRYLGLALPCLLVWSCSVSAQDLADAQSIPTKAFTESKDQASQVVEVTSEKQLQQLLKVLTASEPSAATVRDGREYTFPGRYLIRGRVPGYGTKCPDELNAGWYSFSLRQSWPDKVFRAGGEYPTVVAVGRLFYRTSFEYQAPDPKEARHPKADRPSQYKPGDQVPAKFRFEVEEVWTQQILKEKEPAPQQLPQK